MYTARIDPAVRKKIAYALKRVDGSYREINIKLSINAIRVANPNEYDALLREQGEDIYNWRIFGSGLSPHSTVSRWRRCRSVRIEAHCALCLATFYLTGMDATIEQLTAPPLAPFVLYIEKNHEIQQMVKNFRTLRYYPRNNAWMCTG